MIEDQGQHVIVSRSYGNYETYACTLANAHALLAQHEEQLNADVKQLAELDRETHYVVNGQRLVKAMRDVMAKEVGEASAQLRAQLYGNGPRKAEDDERPQAVVTQELKDEVTLWCVKHRINPLSIPDINAERINKDLAGTEFSLLQGVKERAKGRALVFVDDWALQAAEEYTQLKTGTWKAEAAESRVVSRYLQFITEYLVDRSDVTYEVSQLKQTV